jgi:hypothetical protein
MNIFWIIYLGLLGTAAIGYLIKGKYKGVLAKIDFIISIITWIGLFGFVTNTKMLSLIIWKIVFVGGLLWDVIYGLFLSDFYKNEADEDIPVLAKKIIAGVILIITVGPLYYGLYRYAFYNN